MRIRCQLTDTIHPDISFATIRKTDVRIFSLSASGFSDTRRFRPAGRPLSLTIERHARGRRAPLASEARAAILGNTLFKGYALPLFTTF